MPSVCCYFQVHQPYRLRHYHMFEVGDTQDYFDDVQNREICQKVARKCYLPANALMLDLLNTYPDFRISFSISGVALEQFAEYTPEVLASFQKLVATGKVEILSETYYHSLSSLFDPNEFTAQVTKHRETVQHYFGVTPTVFRNTELIYSNAIAEMVEKMGFQAILTEGADRVLDWRSPNFMYEPINGHGIKLLLKNYKLSDDIAFRFSQQSWPEWPLRADTYAHWLHQIDGNGDVVNLFMDYETFGEHQWEESGIFDFFHSLPQAILQNPQFTFATPSQVATQYPSVDKLSIPEPISWADTERDTSAWLGNPMQDSMVAWVYRLGEQVRASKNEHLIHAWRKLQTSDHFYYMCTKFWNDGDVHKYFSVYDRPHDAYVILNNILSDLEIRLGQLPTPVDAITPAPRQRSITHAKAVHGHTLKVRPIGKPAQ